MATQPFVNMVEIERSVLARHCLDRRFQSVEVLCPEIEAWEEESNERMAEWSGSSPQRTPGSSSAYSTPQPSSGGLL